MNPSPSTAIETITEGDVSSPPLQISLSIPVPHEGPFEAPSKVDNRSFEFSSIALPEKPMFTNKFEEREYLKTRLALAFRIFAKLGFDEGLAGHITLRDPVEPTSFWVNPFGRPWPTMKASDLIRVDKDGTVVDGGKCRRLNIAAYMIHHATHSHSVYGRSFCALGRNIETISQDACAFHNDVELYSSFRGAVLGPEEGQEIAKALGTKKAALLQNHGLLTCGRSIESCVFWFMSLERCCQVQLLADAAAGGRGHETVKIDEEDAVYTWKLAGTEAAGYASALPTFELMEEECNWIF